MNLVYLLIRVYQDGASHTNSVHVDAVGAMAFAEKIDAVRHEFDMQYAVKEWRTSGSTGMNFAGINGESRPRTVWRVQAFEVKD